MNLVAGRGETAGGLRSWFEVSASVFRMRAVVGAWGVGNNSVRCLCVSVLSVLDAPAAPSSRPKHIVAVRSHRPTGASACRACSVLYSVNKRTKPFSLRRVFHVLIFKLAGPFRQTLIRSHVLQGNRLPSNSLPSDPVSDSPGSKEPREKMDEP